MTRSLQIATVNYATGNAAQLEWQADHTDFIIGGADVVAYNPDVKWALYIDSAIIYAKPSISDLYERLREFCTDNSYTFEDCFVHMKQDYTATPHGWNYMDQFDCFEAANGVIADSGGTLTDKTSTAYTTATITFSTNLYIGYDAPFDRATFTVSVAASSLVGQWQYWNGSSWYTFSPTSDGTSGFTQSGTVVFTPPSNWARTTVNSSWSKYFIRYAVTSATTTPTITRVRGDDWRSSVGSYTNRGWDETDGNIVNSGELAYNPTPPANATAKFRHQSRCFGGWSTTDDTFLMNPAYVVSTKYVWAEFLSEVIVADAGDTNAIMCDDLNYGVTGGVSAPSNPESYSDISDYTANTLEQEKFETYKKIVEYVHALDADYLVGGNTTSETWGREGDFALYESAAYTVTNNGPLLRVTSVYDQYLDAVNPNGSQCLFIAVDKLYSYTYGGSTIFWDKVDRGPMIALCTHYISANDNMALSYFGAGNGNSYNLTDEFYVWNDSGTTTTQDVSVDTTSGTKTIYGTDFSGFPSTGTAKVGDGNVIAFTKASATTLTTTSAIYFAKAAGTTVRYKTTTADKMSNYADGEWPVCDDVYTWHAYFPAMFEDVGVPDVNGWNGGARGTWDSTYVCPIYRRDYTNAIMLHRYKIENAGAAQMESYYGPTYLGANYRRLHADGTYDDPVSEISLRIGESAILFKDGSGPSIVSASVNASGNTVTVEFSESCLPASGASGLSLSGTQASVNAGTISGTTGTFPLTGKVVADERPLLRFSNTGGNITASASGNAPLLAAGDVSVVNNSIYLSAPETIIVESVSYAIAASTGDGAVIVDAPTGTQAGDLLVAIGSSAYLHPMSPPAGWAINDTRSFTSGNADTQLGNLYVWSKVATAEDIGPFLFMGGGWYLRGHVAILRISGAYGIGSVASAISSASSQSLTCPNLSVLDSGSMVLSVDTCQSWANSTGGSLDEVHDADSAVAFHLGIYSQGSVAAGAYTGQAITGDVTQSRGIVATIAISPRMEYMGLYNTDCETIASGNWGDESTWDLGNIPGTGETATIDPAHTVTLDDDKTCGELTVLGGLIIAGHTLTAEAAVTFGSSSHRARLTFGDSGVLAMGTNSLSLRNVKIVGQSTVGTPGEITGSGEVVVTDVISGKVNNTRIVFQ